MKLYNKSGPSLIIDVKYVLSGGRFSEHDQKKDRKYFDVDSDIEVTDEYGEKLLKMYPKLKRTDQTREAPIKKRSKRIKVVQKTKKKKR
jgi:hypothetical protein